MAKPDTLMDALRNAVEQINGTVIGELDDGVLEVLTADGQTLTLNVPRMRSLVDNGSETIDSVIARFLHPTDYFVRQMSDPKNQRNGLRLMLENAGILENADDILHQPLSDQLIIVLAWSDPEETGLVLLSETNMSEWSITSEDAWSIASENMNALLRKTPVELMDVGDDRVLAMLSTGSALKASLILAPQLRQHVESHIGWPVYAVIPCRDFIYLVPTDERGDRTLPALGSTVVEEYEQSPYPLSTEVFQISDDAIEAIGAFAAQEN